MRILLKKINGMQAEFVRQKHCEFARVYQRPAADERLPALPNRLFRQVSGDP
jgi:hypothetical protein